MHGLKLIHVSKGVTGHMTLILEWKLRLKYNTLTSHTVFTETIRAIVCIVTLPSFADGPD